MARKNRSMGESVLAGLITFSILRQLSKNKRSSRPTHVVVRPGESAVGALNLPYHLYVPVGEQVDKVYWEGPNGEELPPVLDWDNYGSYASVTLKQRGSVIFVIATKSNKKYTWILAA